MESSIIKEYTTAEKLEILADAAKYDVACTSSGVSRSGKKGELGNASAAGICHSFAADGRCISLLKILMTNHCVYDCKYCINRASNDVPRVTFTPEEICTLTVEFYKRNYIEGLFLSSGILKNPTYTMEKMCETLTLLRTKYHFNGYIHVKTIPGAADELLARMGYLADRVSVNLELPTAESLQKLAPNKTFHTILDPMGKVRDTIAAHRTAIGKDRLMERSNVNKYLTNSIFSEQTKKLTGDSKRTNLLGDTVKNTNLMTSNRGFELAPRDLGSLKRSFAPAGQSTQMIIGATGESDYTLLQTTQQLYTGFDLKRVFYSAYIPLNEDAALPALGTAPPLLREHRLYQADWLLRFYGFQADELLTEERPNFNELLDPKCEWALRHIELFPLEIMTAEYQMLLRVPGIGPKSAGRIMYARRYGSLDFTSLKKMGVVLKRAHYFITCNGKQMYRTPIEEAYITRQLIGVDYSNNWKVANADKVYEQMSLADFGIA
ncbi:MAG: putative DNA modification/repair radical SAM protein [Lachnospiraceae bacterium]|nr:putative DNA modification/repair radical SAM protein [Lachnospiraceae bacterium]